MPLSRVCGIQGWFRGRVKVRRIAALDTNGALLIASFPFPWRLPVSERKLISINNRTYTVFGDASDHYFQNIEGELQSLEKLKRVLEASSKTGTWLDVGANCGLATLAMASVHQGQIFAYEPQPSVFRNLAKSMNANGLDDVITRNVALNDSSKSLRFFPGGPINNLRTSGSHTVIDSSWEDAGQMITVEATTIDQEAMRWNWRDVPLVKIDVEGFEQDVIAGGVKTFDRFSPIVLLEFNSWCLVALSDRSPKQFLEFLKRTFRNVLAFEDDLTMRALQTDRDCLEFLHRNLTARGCVDDLVCCNDLDKLNARFTEHVMR
jgi:FkbM family methyltransferase